jgi:site-specific DNA-methyltransferase (adenine-specific)
MGDVWDIGIVAPYAKERTGWPTQKPEALLERLILACTNPGDLVISPYCGSGTVGAVCVKHNRSCVEIDRNNKAVEVAKRRLSLLGVVL